MRKDILLRMADKLVGEGAYTSVGPVPLHKFDMEYLYCEQRGDGAGIFQEKFKPRQCKTSACVLGWSMVDPWFKRRGLKTADRLFDAMEISEEEFEILFVAQNYKQGRLVPRRTVANRIRKFVAAGTQDTA